MTRRLTAVAGIAAVLLALAACRSSPDVAAYVGDQQLTEARVTAIYDELQAAQTEEFLAEVRGKRVQARTPAPNFWPAIGRDDIVAAWVLARSCEQARSAGGEPGPSEVSPELIEFWLGAPVATEHNRTVVQAWVCVDTVESAPIEPTEQDYRDAYDFVVRGNPDPEPFDVVASNAEFASAVGALLGMRNAVVDYVSGVDVTVNPRYRPLTFPIRNLDFVAVPLGRASAVTDR